MLVVLAMSIAQTHSRYYPTQHFGMPGKETFWQAAKKGQTARLLELLRDGQDPNQLDAGATALYWAVYYDQPAAVALLLEHGADPNAHDSLGFYPLHAVSFHSGQSIGIAHALLWYGASTYVTWCCSMSAAKKHTHA